MAVVHIYHSRKMQSHNIQISKDAPVLTLLNFKMQLFCDIVVNERMHYYLGWLSEPTEIFTLTHAAELYLIFRMIYRISTGRIYGNVSAF